MIPELLNEFPEGSDLTIMNTYYNFPVYQEDKGKVCDDFICLVYKDNRTGQKGYKIITQPEYTYYKAKEGLNLDYNRLFIERDKVEPITVKFKDLEKSIAEQTNNIEFYKQNVVNRDKSSNRKLHTEPSIFFSDSNIEDHYRFKFAQLYTNNIEKIHKGFFDIEVDGKFAAGDFVEMGECDINCVSFMDERSDKVYTFILRNPNNPLIEKFENKVISGEFNYSFIHNFVVNAVGGAKMANKSLIKSIS